MPILDERHDFAHPVEPDTAWSESYYFNAYDPVTDAGLFTRIGVRPHEGTMDVGLSVWLPGSELATIHGVRPQHEMTDSDLAVAGVRYRLDVPAQLPGAAVSPEVDDERFGPLLAESAEGVLDPQRKFVAREGGDADFRDVGIFQEA